ncbi:MAG TPA: methyltransferase domain-containing protein, partial [Actinomycetales bacterium]|nr:methyltransferase domain-containing protein [Actinomycetales bacterium]
MSRRSKPCGLPSPSSRALNATSSKRSRSLASRACPGQPSGRSSEPPARLPASGTASALPDVTYGDQRLAVIYDLDNPDGSDHDYFRSLVDDANAEVVTDLGCGTGILTVTLTRPGRRVVGIDPAPAMLARAASRPGGGG